jgi:hypothetical protein
MNSGTIEEYILDKEYKRLFDNELIFFDAVQIWKRLEKISTVIVLILGFSLLFGYFAVEYSLPENSFFLLHYSTYPFHFLFIVVGFGLFFTFLVVYFLAQNKIYRITQELGLHREERLFLRAYETKQNIRVYLNDSTNRRLYFKKLAKNFAQELLDLIEDWNYGDIRLAVNWFGEKIYLLKDNMKRLILPTIINGREKELWQVYQSLNEFCMYLHSPSVKKLDELNNTIIKIPFKEYKDLYKMDKLRAFFQNKPRISRLFFSFSVTLVVIVVLWNLEGKWGLIIAVGVACFWGAFSGFDKIFRLKEK